MADIEKNLILYFTLGRSLEKWAEVGMLEREIAPYNILAKKFDKIYFFTYGTKKDLEYKNYLEDNIEIVYNKYNLSKYLYSLIGPFLNFRIITNNTILKSNQILGSWAALISGIISKNTKLVIRTGYTASLLEKSMNGRSLKYRGYTLIEYIMYKLCDKAIVTSLESKEYIIKKYNIKESKIEKIPNYIDTEIFKPLEIPENKKNGRILFIGRITKVKNLKELIKALKCTWFGLDIIGEGSKKLKDELLANIIDLKFLGTVPNHKLPEIINKYEIFILPSLREGMPKTLLEAMSCGMPCIGTKVPGISEVIVDNFNGLLTETESKDLYNTIFKLYHNKKLQKELGKNARYTIINFFSLKKLIKKEIDLYENL